MQYLPDIIQLQQFLSKSHNMNVDDEQVNKATVMDLHQLEGMQVITINIMYF